MSEIYKAISPDDLDWFAQDESGTYRSNIDIDPRVKEGVRSINETALGSGDIEPDIDMLYFYGVLMVVGLELSDKTVIQKYFGDDTSNLPLEKRVNIGIRAYLTESGEIGNSEEMYNIALSLSRLACFIKRDTSFTDWRGQPSLSQAFEDYGVNRLAGHEITKGVNDELEVTSLLE